MKKIAIMEKTNFSQEQIARLQVLGEVSFFENLTDEQVNKLAPQYDIVVVNWIDPSDFLLAMKPGSLLALLSTGYGWIRNISESYTSKIYISNIPGYATEAVAEHLLGLLLGLTKRIFVQLGNMTAVSEKGIVITGKTVGIIGLGRIGLRFAELLSTFYPKIITYNRTAKNVRGIDNVSLEKLLSSSNIICITPSYNNSSASLINEGNIHLIQNQAILIGATWGIISDNALIELIEKKNVRVAFDVAVEGGIGLDSSKIAYFRKYFDQGKLFFTPHVAYDDIESEIQQLEICVSNIEHFINGTMQNIVPIEKEKSVI